MKRKRIFGPFLPLFPLLLLFSLNKERKMKGKGIFSHPLTPFLFPLFQGVEIERKIEKILFSLSSPLSGKGKGEMKRKKKTPFHLLSLIFPSLLREKEMKKGKKKEVSSYPFPTPFLFVKKRKWK